MFDSDTNRERAEVAIDPCERSMLLPIHTILQNGGTKRLSSVANKQSVELSAVVCVPAASIRRSSLDVTRPNGFSARNARWVETSILFSYPALFEVSTSTILVR